MVFSANIQSITGDNASLVFYPVGGASSFAYAHRTTDTAAAITNADGNAGIQFFTADLARVGHRSNQQITSYTPNHLLTFQLCSGNGAIATTVELQMIAGIKVGFLLLSTFSI